jgi:hypothetical protein
MLGIDRIRTTRVSPLHSLSLALLDLIFNHPVNPAHPVILSIPRRYSGDAYFWAERIEVASVALGLAGLADLAAVVDEAM